MLVGSACSQPVAERPTFEVPTEIVPDWVNPADVEELFPPEGGCLLAVGGGVRILEVLEDSGAYGRLRAGDIVTGLDGIPVSTQETLLGVLRGGRVDDVVRVEGVRAGEPFSFEVQLSPVPGEPRRAVLGIIPETKLEVVSPAEVPASGVIRPLSRPVILDGGVYVHDPLAATWFSFPGASPVRGAALGPDLYAVGATDPLSLVKVGEGVAIPIDPGPVVVESRVGLVEVVASRFETVLASVGDLVLVAGEAAAEGSTAFAVHAVDPVERSVVWTRILGLSPSGNPLVAVDGYLSPSGDRALVVLVEQDPAGGTRSGVWSYYLLDEQGEGEIGPPGIDRFLPTSGVTGWYDDGSLLYVADLDTPQIARWALDTGEHSVMRPVPVEEAFDLVTVVPVGDGQHVVQVRANDVSLINVDQPSSVRPISRGCRYAPIGEAAAGSQPASVAPLVDT